MQNNGFTRPSENVFVALLKYLRPVMWRNLIGVIMLMGMSYLSIQVPMYIKFAVNGIKQANQPPEEGQPIAEIYNESQLFEDCLVIFGLAFLAAVLLFLARWLIIGASREIERQLRNDLFAHIQRLTPRFYQQHKTGDLVTRFASDIESVRLLVGPGIMYPGQTILITILAFIAMFSISVSLTLTLLIPTVILLVYVNLNTRILHKVYKEAQDLYSDLTAKVQENLSGIRVIKAYCQEEAELERFRKINEKYVERNIEQIKIRGRLFPFMKFIGGVGIVLILWRGGLLVIEDNGFMLGELIQFALYYQYLIWPIIALGWIINVIHRGIASWKRVHSVLATPPEVLLGDDAHEVPQLKGDIEFRNLTFSYTPDSPPVLHNISFHVHPGETLAIIGPTGSGKTTIVNLLLHFYKLPRGCIFFDGIDVNDISMESLRRSIGYVSQEVFLFSDSIRNNILFGMENHQSYNGDSVRYAARQAQLDRDLESFPKGFETEIGERGIALSGGQKQRTGIARALILDRPILILDDCLSAVDTDTEEAILQGLRSAMQQRTAIVISHRISTVKNADQILVVDDGRIIERGTHEELLEHQGLYAQIHKRQLLEESLGIRS